MTWPPKPHLDNTGASCRIDRDHDCCYTCNAAAGEDVGDDDRVYDGADAEPPDCTVCAGPLVPLGQLGDRTHYRCRACGWEQSV